MNTYYLKNYSKNYMILEDFCDYKHSSDFRLKMITNNHINNTLPLTYEINNDTPVFKYNITSLQAIATIFEDKEISLNEYLSIVTSLIDVMDDLEKYLFDINSIILRANYVYMDPENFATHFTICPAWNEDFYSELNIFFEDLLNRIDHSNERLVYIAYKLYTESSKEEFNLSKVKSILYDSDYNTKTDKADIDIIEETIAASNLVINDTTNKNELLSDDLSIQKIANTSLIYKLKLVCFSIFFIILFILCIYLSFEKGITNSITVLCVFFSLTLIIGITKYMLLIYPEAIVENVTNPDVSSAIDESTTNSVDAVSKQAFGKTEVLESSKKTTHHLIYVGTDYSENVEINTFPFKIGKLPDTVQLIINNPLVSRIHACLYEEDSSFYIEDLNSTNGTFINGNMLSPHCKQKINSGDQITFSHITYLFE